MNQCMIELHQVVDMEILQDSVKCYKRKVLNQTLCFFWLYLSTNCSGATTVIAPAPGILFGFSASHTRYLPNVGKRR